MKRLTSDDELATAIVVSIESIAVVAWIRQSTWCEPSEDADEEKSAINASFVIRLLRDTQSLSIASVRPSIFNSERSQPRHARFGDPSFCLIESIRRDSDHLPRCGVVVGLRVNQRETAITP